MKRTREQVEPNSSPEADTKIGRIHSPDQSQSTIGQVNKGQCVTAQTAAELPTMTENEKVIHKDIESL